MKKRIGVLLSGRGSNFEALAESVAAGRIPNAEIAVVISNREGAPGIQRAEARGIKTSVIPSKGLEREVYDRQVAAVLDEQQVDLLCLAGYMRLLSPFFVARFLNRILNIHPSLLPSFPGLESQRQALEYGVKFAGCTVHFVDEMDGATSEFHAVFEGLALRFQPGERREQRRMNIQDAVQKSCDKKGRQQAHVSGETDQIDLLFVKNRSDLTVIDLALQAFRRNHARLDSTRFRALDARRALAIADDDGDLRVRNPSRRNAFRQGFEVRAAAA